MIEELQNILLSVKNQVGDEFSGLGILVCSEYADLPIFPLRNENEFYCKNDLIECLSLISNIHNSNHDGFHIIDANWNLVKVSQYLSPPIEIDLCINYDKNFGSRYLAAIFGSKIQGVLLAGIISNAFGMAIFKDGEEVLYENIV